MNERRYRSGWVLRREWSNVLEKNQEWWGELLARVVRGSFLEEATFELSHEGWRTRETRGYEASSCRRAWKGGVEAEETARFKGAETGKSRLATSTSVFLSVNWRPWHSLPAGGVGVIVKIITILRCTSSFTKADLSASLGNRFTNHCCECRSRIWFRCWNGPTYRHTRLHACTRSSQGTRACTHSSHRHACIHTHPDTHTEPSHGISAPRLHHRECRFWHFGLSCIQLAPPSVGGAGCRRHRRRGARLWVRTEPLN